MDACSHYGWPSPTSVVASGAFAACVVVASAAFVARIVPSSYQFLMKWGQRAEGVEVQLGKQF